MKSVIGFNTFILFGCLIAITGALQAKEFSLQDPLRWGYYDFEPYIYTDQNGKPAGEMATVLKGLMNDLDIPFRALPYPNRRFIKLLENQQLDFTFAVKSSFTQPEKVIFSRFPVAIIELRVYWLKGKTADITQVQDLVRKPLLTLAGFAYGGLINRPPFNEVRSTTVENHERALRALILGRASYLLDYRLPVEQVLLNTDGVSLNFLPVHKTPVFMALSTEVVNATELMSSLESSYQKLFPELYLKYND
jgi:polar amino acid transport system substrate-binding protein